MSACLLSQGVPWPGASDWRPAGWRTGLEPADLTARLAEVRAGRLFGEVFPKTISFEAARGDAALLRDCWSTTEWIWRIAEQLVGPPAVDPFWNPWGLTHILWSGVRLLDGREGRDGFDPTAWGEGTAYVNWPHSDNARGVAAATAHARRGQPVAAVAPLDGCDWVMGAGTPDDLARADLFSAELVILLGRVSFRPPPGVSESSPRSAYALGLWGLEEGIAQELAGKRMWCEAAGRELVAVPGCADVTSAPRGRRRRGRPAAAEQPPAPGP